MTGCLADRSCQLATVLGVAGVGKSRLTAEFISRLPTNVRVLRGRCLSYGEGWVSSTDNDGEVDAVADRNRLAAQVNGDAEAARMVDLLAPLAGLAGNPGSPEETHWAVRRWLEHVSAETPLVLVVDDIHWAEQDLLDLLDHLTDWVRGVPLLLLCLARPEFVDDHPGWGGGKLRSSTMLLQPLAEQETVNLMSHLLGAGALDPASVDLIRKAAGGVPLYVEHLLAMLVDDGTLVRASDGWKTPRLLGEVDIPPTVSALLAARLDRLPPDERAVLEAAAVAGEVFYRGAIVALMSIPPSEADRSLAALTRKDLVGPRQSDLPNEQGLAFSHALVREVAYRSLAKARRDDLHEQFGRWLDARSGQAAADMQALVAHHFGVPSSSATSSGPVTTRPRRWPARRWTGWSGSPMPAPPPMNDSLTTGWPRPPRWPGIQNSRSASICSPRS